MDEFRGVHFGIRHICHSDSDTHQNLLANVLTSFHSCTYRLHIRHGILSTLPFVLVRQRQWVPGNWPRTACGIATISPSIIRNTNLFLNVMDTRPLHHFISVHPISWNIFDHYHYILLIFIAHRRRRFECRRKDDCSIAMYRMDYIRNGYHFLVTGNHK